jgi:glycine cleavage system H protein
MFTKEHEWVYREDDIVRIGVTDFAQKELGDIVFVELKDGGTQLEAGDELGTIESVKAVAEVYAPVPGELLTANDVLTDKPETVNEDPYGDGWLVTFRPSDPSSLEDLMTHEAYSRFLEEED